MILTKYCPLHPHNEEPCSVCAAQQTTTTGTMQKTPDQILAEGVAAKENSVKDSSASAQRVQVKDEQFSVCGPDIFQDVIDFHEKFGINYDGPPRELPVELATFRDAAEVEELMELRKAKDHKQNRDIVDAYVDYIYFVLGRFHLQGWDFNKAWKKVHDANMRKERANTNNPSKRSQAYGMKFDIVKPEGWVPPDHTDIVTVP